MPDRISRYRQIRLVLAVPRDGQSNCHWHLVSVDVRKGVPQCKVIADGDTELPGDSPSMTELREALYHILRDLTRR